MALKEWNTKPGDDKVAVQKLASVTAVTGGATSLGGTTGIRVLVDDAVITSKHDALRLLNIIEQKLTEDAWPPA